MAFDRVEGFGGPLLEMMLGIVAARIVNSSMRRPEPPLQPEDSMPHYDTEQPDGWEQLQRWKAEHGDSRED